MVLMSIVRNFSAGIKPTEKKEGAIHVQCLISVHFARYYTGSQNLYCAQGCAAAYSRLVVNLVAIFDHTQVTELGEAAKWWSQLSTLDANLWLCCKCAQMRKFQDEWSLEFMIELVLGDTRVKWGSLTVSSLIADSAEFELVTNLGWLKRTPVHIVLLVKLKPVRGNSMQLFTFRRWMTPVRN